MLLYNLNKKNIFFSLIICLDKKDLSFNRHLNFFMLSKKNKKNLTQFKSTFFKFKKDYYSIIDIFKQKKKENRYVYA